MLKSMTYIAFMTFDSCISLYDLDNEEEAKMETISLPGHTTNIPKNSKSLLCGQLTQFKSITDCKDKLKQILNALQYNKDSNKYNAKRCLGTAINEAIAMIDEFKWKDQKGKEFINSINNSIK